MPCTDWNVLKKYSLPKPSDGLLAVFNDTVLQRSACWRTSAPRDSLYGTLWNVGTYPGSLRLDARELDHPCPFFRFSRDKSAEIRGAENHRYGAKLGEP